MQICQLINNIDIIKISDENIISTDITGICCNSETALRGELFVAVKGYKNDGHDFIEDAAVKGVACVICEVSPTTDIPYILVSDSRKALAGVSAAWFGDPADKMKMIGITGTNGKTSCTYLIKHILEKCNAGKVGLIGTIGNKIGDREISATLTTPDSYELQSILAKMAMEGCQYVVMEVSSHALCLSRVYGISYDIGIFTNLTPEHLDFHNTMDEYADAKALLFKNSKKSIINIDDNYSQLMIKSSPGKVITYAIENSEADITGKEINLYSNKVEFCAVTPAVKSFIKVHIPGLFTVYNALAVMAAMLETGLDEKSIADSLSTCQGISGRAEVLSTGCDFTVIVDYAHTPDALMNILEAARTQNSGRVITVFGCGGDRDKAKRPVMGKIATQLSDFTIITSDNPRTEDPQKIISDITSGIEDKPQSQTSENYTTITDRKVAICKAIDILTAGDVLLIAGKGHEIYQILGEEKIFFSDREVVEEYLTAIRKDIRNRA